MDSDLFAPRDLPEALRAIISRAGLTVEETAHRAELGISTLHNYLRSGEGGRTPGARELRRLTRVIAHELDPESADGVADELWLRFGRLLDSGVSEETVAAAAAVSSRRRTRTRRA